MARAVGDLPALDGALRAGQISYSKVRALTRVATPANEASLLEIARSSTASQLERICRGVRRALRNERDEPPEDEPHDRWVRRRDTEAGFVRLDIQLRPEEAAVVLRALDVVIERAGNGPDVSGGTRPASLRRADALLAMAEGCLAGGAAGDAAGPPVELVVQVEGDGGTLDDGTVLPPATVERLACDATVVEVIEDARGAVLDVGRRRRTIPALLRRALALRDRGCRFPGCTNRRVDGHHSSSRSDRRPHAEGSRCLSTLRAGWNPEEPPKSPRRPSRRFPTGFPKPSWGRLARRGRLPRARRGAAHDGDATDTGAA